MLPLLILSLFAVTTTVRGQHQVCMIVPKSTQECFNSFQGTPINTLSAQVSCLQDLLWNFKPDKSLNDRDQQLLQNITQRLGGTETSFGLFGGSTSRSGEPLAAEQSRRSGARIYPYPPSGYRVRKEYRLLTPTEREKFHRALNQMHWDGVIHTFAKIHAQASDRHHMGASFLPWHRIYLSMFEEYLRYYDPTVSLPYWASVLDDNMAGNPVNSILWTSDYFGNGDGMVTSGPAAYWTTDQGRLERNYGRGSRLFKTEDIERVLTQCRLANISRPTANRQFDLESMHGGPHVWVGGDMSAFDTTGFDPVFYMHHAYVDYLWELFRRRQRSVCGIEPAFDYPEVLNGNPHHSDAPMTGFTMFTNKDGIKPYWTQSWYGYDAVPTCPNCCPGCIEPAPLYCDQRRNRCVSRSTILSENGVVVLPFAARLTTTSMPPPRNRGRLFEAPPSDGRTIETAQEDAMRAASEMVATTGTIAAPVSSLP